jgi:transcriptional regulator with XRE-family HTH domain
MTKLREYRKAQKITIADMAPLLGVSTASLSRIENGSQWPDRDFFERLPEVTCGHVTANDFIPSPSPQREGEAA